MLTIYNRGASQAQHVDKKTVEINMLLVLACHNNVFDTVICLTQKFMTKQMFKTTFLFLYFTIKKRL